MNEYTQTYIFVYTKSFADNLTFNSCFVWHSHEHCAHRTDNVHACVYILTLGNYRTYAASQNAHVRNLRRPNKRENIVSKQELFWATDNIHVFCSTSIRRIVGNRCLFSGSLRFMNNSVSWCVINQQNWSQAIIGPAYYKCVFERRCAHFYHSKDAYYNSI